MGDVEDRVNDLLAAATTQIRWMERFLAGDLGAISDVPDIELAANLAAITTALNDSVRLLAHEIDLLRTEITSSHRPPE
jgi:hypothetical protein